MHVLTNAQGRRNRRCRAYIFGIGVILQIAGPTYAEVRGTVRWDGPLPERKPVDLNADPICARNAAGMKEEQFVVQDGGLVHAFVYIKNPPPKRYAPRRPPALDQTACRFTPRVLGLMVGQKLEIINSDPTLHNVRGVDGKDRFNRPMPRQDQKIYRRFKSPKVMVSLHCDLHPWMRAFIGVMTHPYFAVTDNQGNFRIDTTGLPDGTYALSVWHEILGEKTVTLTLEKGTGQKTIAYRPTPLPTLRQADEKKDKKTR